MIESKPPPPSQPPLPEMRPSLDQEFFTYTDVCDLFKVTRQTVMHWVKNGRMPSPRYIGATARFVRADILAVIDGPAARGTFEVRDSPRSETATLAYVKRITKPKKAKPKKAVAKQKPKSKAKPHTKPTKRK